MKLSRAFLAIIALSFALQSIYPAEQQQTWQQQAWSWTAKTFENARSYTNNALSALWGSIKQNVGTSAAVVALVSIACGAAILKKQMGEMCENIEWGDKPEGKLTTPATPTEPSAPTEALSVIPAASATPAIDSETMPKKDDTGAQPDVSITPTPIAPTAPEQPSEFLPLPHEPVQPASSAAAAPLAQPEEPFLDQNKIQELIQKALVIFSDNLNSNFDNEFIKKVANLFQSNDTPATILGNLKTLLSPDSGSDFKNYLNQSLFPKLDISNLNPNQIEQLQNRFKTRLQNELVFSLLPQFWARHIIHYSVPSATKNFSSIQEDYNTAPPTIDSYNNAMMALARLVEVATDNIAYRADFFKSLNLKETEPIKNMLNKAKAKTIEILFNELKTPQTSQSSPEQTTSWTPEQIGQTASAAASSAGSFVQEKAGNFYEQVRGAAGTFIDWLSSSGTSTSKSTSPSETLPQQPISSAKPASAATTVSAPIVVRPTSTKAESFPLEPKTIQRPAVLRKPAKSVSVQPSFKPNEIFKARTDLINLKDLNPQIVIGTSVSNSDIRFNPIVSILKDDYLQSELFEYITKIVNKYINNAFITVFLSAKDIEEKELKKPMPNLNKLNQYREKNREKIAHYIKEIEEIVKPTQKGMDLKQAVINEKLELTDLAKDDRSPLFGPLSNDAVQRIFDTESISLQINNLLNAKNGLFDTFIQAAVNRYKEQNAIDQNLSPELNSILTSNHFKSRIKKLLRDDVITRINQVKEKTLQAIGSL